MRYMVVERFKPDSVKEIYERVQERGRMLPSGLEYLDSWVSSSLDVCFQLMECENERLFEEWFRCWNDLIEFEVIPVISSSQASTLAAQSLSDEKHSNGSQSDAR